MIALLDTSNEWCGHGSFYFYMEGFVPSGGGGGGGHITSKSNPDLQYTKSDVYIKYNNILNPTTE